MKKLSLLVGGLILTGAVMAQKPADGAPMSLEGGISYSTATLNFVAPTIRFRYFLSENLAARLTFSMANTKTSDNHYELANNEGAVGTEVNKTSMFGVALGAEYHFAGTEKLSPYVGLDIKFGGGGTAASWDNYNGFGYAADYTREDKAKTGMFGVNLVAGADYYFVENLYIGMELGFGFTANSTKAGESTVTTGGTSTTTKTPDSKSSALGNNVVGNFRLGWRF